MCGLPASGKTTKAKEIVAEEGAEYVSSDEIRKELYGDESDQTNPNKVFEIMFSLFEDIGLIKIKEKNKPTSNNCEEIVITLAVILFINLTS